MIYLLYINYHDNRENAEAITSPPPYESECRRAPTEKTPITPAPPVQTHHAYATHPGRLDHNDPNNRRKNLGTRRLYSNTPSVPPPGSSRMKCTPRSLRGGEKDSNQSLNSAENTDSNRASDKHDHVATDGIQHANHNTVGSAAAFFTKTVKALKPWEEILAPGVIQRLATKYNIPDLGETIFNLMHTTHLFKPRGRRPHETRRDFATFPRADPEVLDRSRTQHPNEERTQAEEATDPSTRIPNWPPLGPQRQIIDDYQELPVNQCRQDHTECMHQPEEHYGSSRRSSASSTYAHVLKSTNKPDTQDPSNHPTMATPTSPIRMHSNTSSPTISSLSGTSSATSARSTLLSILKTTTPPEHKEGHKYDGVSRPAPGMASSHY